jgi:hypothetical protein
MGPPPPPPPPPAGAMPELTGPPPHRQPTVPVKPVPAAVLQRKSSAVGPAVAGFKGASQDSMSYYMGIPAVASAMTSTAPGGSTVVDRPDVTAGAFSPTPLPFEDPWQ